MLHSTNPHQMAPCKISSLWMQLTADNVPHSRVSVNRIRMPFAVAAQCRRWYVQLHANYSTCDTNKNLLIKLCYRLQQQLSIFTHTYTHIPECLTSATPSQCRWHRTKHFSCDRKNYDKNSQEKQNHTIFVNGLNKSRLDVGMLGPTSHSAHNR